MNLNKKTDLNAFCLNYDLFNFYDCRKQSLITAIIIQKFEEHCLNCDNHLNHTNHSSEWKMSG